MPRPKGTTKTGGRKKGTKNKNSAELKNWILEFLSQNTEELEVLLKNSDKDTKLNIILALFPKLMPYVIPKQTEQKITYDEKIIEATLNSIDKINDLFNKTK